MVHCWPGPTVPQCCWPSTLSLPRSPLPLLPHSHPRADQHRRDWETERYLWICVCVGGGGAVCVCVSFMHSGDLILPVGFLFVCRFECYPLPLPPSPLSLLPSPGNTLLHLFGSWLFEASVWPFHGRVVVSAAVKQSLCTTRTLHCCLQSALS